MCHGVHVSVTAESPDYGKNNRTYRASSAPDVSWCAVASANEHLKSPILARLNVLCELLVGPTGVAEIRDLHLDVTDLLAGIRFNKDGLQQKRSPLVYYAGSVGGLGTDKHTGPFGDTALA